MTKRDSAPPATVRNPLEEAFFRAQDQRLLEKLRETKKKQEARKALSEVSGITNEELLDKLVALGVSPETVASLAVVPLVQVAWADGKVDEKEKQAIRDTLVASGVPDGGVEQQLVDSWLRKRPGAETFEAWRHYVKGLCENMNETERRTLRDELLKSTRAVAEASGGFAGMRSVSLAERLVLEQLQSAFG